MKIAIRLLTLAVCLITALSAHAKRFSYPSAAKEWFSVEIPDDWKPKVDDEETLEATSPDEEAYLAFWVLKGSKEVKGLEKELDDLLKESVTDLKLNEKPTEKTINDIKFTIFAGTAIDKEDKSKVGVEIFLFSPKPGTLGIFYCSYGAKAPGAIKGLVKIVESIKLKQ
jgi:hypothetical protein